MPDRGFNITRSAAQIAVFGTKCLFSIAFFLLLFELVYRFQIVDTYNRELRAYNDRATLETETARRTLLVMGDSFSAGQTSYPGLLHKRLERFRVINSSVPGTGIVQSLLVAPRRFRKFQPTHFVYQIYVGNDLYDISYPVAWGRVSTERNLYWFTSNRLRSLNFLNYRLGGLGGATRDGRDRPDPAPRTAPFSPDSYVDRVKVRFRAEPGTIENHVLVRPERESDFQVLISGVERLVAQCQAPSCKSYLLVIPHCSQVHRRYVENMRQLGAVFEETAALSHLDYPFLARLRQIETRVDNVNVLSPLDALQSAERQGQRIYYENDPHLNPEGQKLLGSWLISAMDLEEETGGARESLNSAGERAQADSDANRSELSS